MDKVKRGYNPPPKGECPPPPKFPSSGSSACSGADARKADKATDYQRVTCLEDMLPKPEVNSLPEAAVSPRSSDGLLPCPFCGADAVYNGVYDSVACSNESCPVQPWTNHSGDRRKAGERWNTRASGSQANNTDESRDG